MQILALETSAHLATVALLRDDELVCEATAPRPQRSAQSLAPAVDAQLQAAGWMPRSIDLVAVSHGPGSFTGLRVGVTFAKCFAYAAEASVMGVDTLDAIAATCRLSTPRLWAVLDAQRKQVFGAAFTPDDSGGWQPVEAVRILDDREWIAGLSPGDGVTGSVLSRLASCLPADVVVAPQDDWMPRAAEVGRLAWDQYRAGQRDELWRLAPKYVRKSAAEEKREQQTGGNAP